MYRLTNIGAMQVDEVHFNSRFGVQINRNHRNQPANQPVNQRDAAAGWASAMRRARHRPCPTDCGGAPGLRRKRLRPSPFIDSVRFVPLVFATRRGAELTRESSRERNIVG